MAKVKELEGGKLQLSNGRILDPRNPHDMAQMQSAGLSALQGLNTGSVERSDPEYAELAAYFRSIPPQRVTDLTGMDSSWTGQGQPPMPKALRGSGITDTEWNQITGVRPDGTPISGPPSQAYLNTLANTQERNGIQGAYQQNQAALDDLRYRQQAVDRQMTELLGQNNQFASNSQGVANWLGQQNAGLTNASWESTNAANAADQQSLGQYTQALQAVGAWDAGNYNQLNDVYGQMGQLQARGYGAPVVSQAALAQADPGAIAAQNQALASLGGWANGSHALTSQAAGAYADPGDVAAQRNAAAALQEIAGGSLDVHVGQEDPEAYAAQQDALRQFGALTTPEVTAAERFIYEQARLRQEQDDRANRAATMTNLRMRGMLGGGAEIGDSALAAQRTSQNRLLSDLGAQANAINRSMVALQGYGGMANTMSSQANQIALSNSALRAQAQEAAYNAYATLRAQGFSEEYARRAAADQMAQFNNTQQLQATGMQGELASTQRAQSFNESFSRGTAADTVAMFNKEQSQITQRFQDEYAAQQQQQAWMRETDRFNAANTVGRNFATDQTNLFGANTQVTDSADRRKQGTITLQGNLVNNTATSQQAAQQLGVNNNINAINAWNQNQALWGNMTSQQNAERSNYTQQMIEAGRASEARASQQRAEDFARQQLENSNSEGLLGTPVLSRNGLLGIKPLPVV